MRLPLRIFLLIRNRRGADTTSGAAGVSKGEARESRENRGKAKAFKRLLRSAARRFLYIILARYFFIFAIFIQKLIL